VLLIVEPVACVDSSICPLKHSFAFSIAISELSIVRVPVCIPVQAKTVVLAILILTFIGCIISPFLNTLTVKLVFDPRTFILRSIKAFIHSMSLFLAIDPISFIEASICIYAPSTAIGFVIHPVSLVYFSIRPNLNPLTLSLVRNLVPLASVENAIIILENGSVF
jgi:hypothetical protein